MKPTLIYQPKGPAGEYAKWAVNLHNGCTHGCTYCYNRRGVLSHAFGEKPSLASPIRKRAAVLCKRENYITPDSEELFMRNCELNAVDDIIRADITKIGAKRLREDGGVFFSFTCDPLEDSNMLYTYLAARWLCIKNIPVTILTKSTEWMEDVNWQGMLKEHKNLLTIGFTLTGMDAMEVNAPSTTERIEALRKVHEMGIKTFVSLEPVIDIKKAMKVIKECNGFADEIRIGVQSPIKKNRYDVRELEAFVAFLHRLVHFEDFHSHITIKRSLCHQIDYLPAAFRRECAGLITEIWMNQQTE